MQISVNSRAQNFNDAAFDGLKMNLRVWHGFFMMRINFQKFFVKGGGIPTKYEQAGNDSKMTVARPFQER